MNYVGQGFPEGKWTNPGQCCSVKQWVSAIPSEKPSEMPEHKVNPRFTIHLCIG